MVRQLVWFLIVPVLLAASSCQPKEEAGIAEKKPAPVEYITLKSRDLPLDVDYVGRLAANREVILAAEVGGLVAGYEADIGDPVEKGRLLVKIAPHDYQLALREARANHAASAARLDAAAKAFRRAASLKKRGVIPQDSYDSALAEFKSAQAAVARTAALVDIAASRLAKAEISAPFAGLISSRPIEIGQMISPGQPVMGLADLYTMRVNIFMTEQDYVHLDKKDPVEVRPEAFPDRSFPGRIDRIGIKADPATGTFPAEILIDNTELDLKTGLSARVRVTLLTIPQAILIPQSAVLYRSGRTEVFVAAPEGIARSRPVTLGRAAGSEVLVTEGLAPGDRLVVTGGQYLNDGDPVKIVERQAPAASQP